MLAVLSGDEEAISESSSNWLELAIAELVHRHPNLKVHGPWVHGSRVHGIWCIICLMMIFGVCECVLPECLSCN